MSYSQHIRHEGASTPLAHDELATEGNDSHASEESSPWRTDRRNTCDPVTTMQAVADAVSGTPSDDHGLLVDSDSESGRPSVIMDGCGTLNEPVAAGEDAVHAQEVVAMAAIAEVSAAPPREVMLTARPGEVSKQQTERRMRLAKQWGVFHPSDEPAAQASPEPAEADAKDTEEHPSAPAHTLRSVPVYGRPSRSRRRVDWKAQPNEQPKRPARQVSLLTVEKARPIPGGVNTPRSLALCEEKGIDPKQLSPKAESTFRGRTVSQELAQVRYNSYEKRRQAHMDLLLPIYKARFGTAREDNGEKVADGVRGSGEEEDAPPATRPRARQGDARPHASSSRAVPNSNRGATRHSLESTELDDYDLDLQRQFVQQEAAMRRSAAMYTRRASASPQPHPSNRGYLSARTATTSVGRATVSPSPAAMRLRSRSLAENRHMTAAEAEVLAEIEYKEHIRLERLSRAREREEIVQMARVEQTLEQERRTEQLVRKRASAKAQQQYEMYNTTVRRQVEAKQRREMLEAERKARLEKMIREKSARSVVHDPYASLLAHRRFVTPAASRAGSPRGPRGG